MPEGALEGHEVQRSATVELPGFVFDLVHSELRTAAGRRLGLRPRSLAVLACLARHVDHTVTKDVLMQVAWPGVVVTDDSLVQSIKDLRRVLNDSKHRIVETESRRGYRLVSATARGGPHPEAALTTSAAFRQEVHFTGSTDGIRIAYATCGGGPPLVRTAQWMTHLEWDWQSSIFGQFIQRLARRNRLVRYDGRGCGLSDRGVPMATLDDEVHDLAAVVDAAGLERFALLGRSQGGAIAIRYAAQCPERVSRLVIIGGFARGALHRGVQSKTLASILAYCNVLEEGWGNANSAFRQMWTSHAFPGATTEQQDSYNHMQSVACSAQDAATIHRMTSDYDASADLSCVQCPTLVLHNPQDALIPFEEGRLIASTIKGARLETFASRNHQPLPGEPAFEQVMQRIDEFLSADTDDPLCAPAAPVRSALRVVERAPNAASTRRPD